MHFSPVASLLLATQLAYSVTAAKTPVSNDLFQKFVRYTKFSAAAYTADCKSPPATIVSYVKNVAANTYATIFRDDTAKEIIVAFRGTATPQDFDTDFQFAFDPLSATGTSCPKCLVHSGFQNYYKSLSADVISTIKQQKQSYPGYSLSVTGHSLGGAVAAIASSSLTGLGYTVTAYTFGEPMNGNSDFKAYIESQVPNYYRVTHANDGVPTLPPTFLGYQHHSTEYWETASGANNTASTTLQCTGADVDQCVTAQSSGDNPINGAHILYSNIVIGNNLFITSCGAVYPS